MKIAVYSNEREKLRWGLRLCAKLRDLIQDLQTCAYGEQHKLFDALNSRSIDLVMLIASANSEVGWKVADCLRRHYESQPFIFLFGEVEALLHIAPAKYTCFFNGNYISMDLKDISFLETLDRKTYVVAGQDKLRVKTRLDIEEQRLPGHQFARLNQGILVNMEHIRCVCGGEVRMKNGSTLHSSRSRKQLFLEKYRQYFLGNCIGLDGI